MRLFNRPDYLLRRFVHNVRVSADVERRNRATAAAFHDPQIDGGGSTLIRFRLSRIKWLSFSLVGSMLAAGMLVESRHPFKSLLMSEYRPETAPSLSRLPDDFLAAPEKSVAAEALVPAASMEPRAPAATDTAVAVKPGPAAVAFPASGFCLVACKRDRTLYVYRRAGARWERTAAYPMAIGRRNGNKSDAGDLRTPEGRYWINGLRPGPMEGPIYGPLVFTLNYPHPGDEAEGKSGHGIWIHGVEAGKLPTFTQGCLSLANEDVLALAAYADVGTPVIILPDSLAPDPDRQIDLEGMQREYPSIMSAYGRKHPADSLAKERALRQARDYVAKEAAKFPELSMQVLTAEEKQAVVERLRAWREDWSSRDIAKYAQHYDSDFRDREGRDKQTFLERKRRIFESKTKIQMEMDEPRIESEGYARVKVSFRQDYVAEGAQGSQRSSGSKTIRLEDGPGGWLIITE